MPEKSTWADCFAVNFYRLTDAEVKEFEANLLHDEKIKNIRQGEIRAAIIRLKEIKDSRFKPAPYDIKKMIVSMRQDKKKPEDFDYEAAYKVLREISDPVERFNKICDLTEDYPGSAGICVKLELFCERLPGGVKRPKLKPFSEVLEELGEAKKPEKPVDWDEKKREAHQKIDKLRSPDEPDKPTSSSSASSESSPLDF